MNESISEKRKRFAKIFWKSRMDAGKSQEFMALELGVTKKTIQNWEKGLSAPDGFQTELWFDVLGLEYEKYYKAYKNPQFFDNVKYDDIDIEKIKQLVLGHDMALSPFELKEALFIMSGESGSPFYSLLQLFVAYCHLSISARFSVASLILNSYEMEDVENRLICEEFVSPDIESLRLSINKGYLAAKQSKYGYNLTTDDVFVEKEPE